MPDHPPTRDPSIVGTIQPGPEGAEPLFERLPGYKERECEHAGFRLDDKWKTVTCGRCDQTLDPYAVLSQYAEWWEEWERARDRARAAEKNLHKEALRRLRDCSDEEAAEIDDVLGTAWYRMDVTETRAMVRRIEKSIQDRKRAKKRAKRKGSDA